MTDAGVLLKGFRKTRTVSLRDLARRTGIDAGQLSRIERGQAGLTYGAIKLIHRALLLKPEEAEQLIQLADPRGRFSEMSSQPHKPEQPSRSRTDVVIEGRAQQILYEYSVRSSSVLQPPIPFRSIATYLGLKIREDGNLPEGVDAELHFDEKEVLLSREPADTRKAFTCCHEIGHWILHRSKLQYACRVVDVGDIPIEDVDLSEAVVFETQANIFAGALLMPSYMVFSSVKQFDAIDQSTISHLAKTFGVSFDAMRVRLLTLGLLEPWVISE